MNRQTDRQADRATNKQKDRQRHRQTDEEIHKQVERHSDKPKNNKQKNGIALRTKWQANIQPK